MTLTAATVQGVLGFGFTLLAISFFLALIGSSTAIQLIILINLIITTSLSLSLWRSVPVRFWSMVFVGAAIGFPIGMAIYANANLDVLKLFAGFVIVTMAALVWFDVSIVPKRFREGGEPSKWISLTVGGVSGILSTALGMPGPILMLYLSSLRLEKEVVRAIAITFLAVAFFVAASVQAVVFEIPRDVVVTAGALVPIAAVGSWTGHRLAPKVSTKLFRNAVLLLITVSGLYTVVSALR